MIAFLVSAICMGITFLYGSTGEIISQKSGHLNLGIPGVMCVGAMSGCYGISYYSTAVGGFDNVVPFLLILIAILASLLGSMLMGLIYSFLTVTLRSNQNVTGLALTTFGVGITNFMIGKIDLFTYSAGTKHFTTLFFSGDQELNWFEEIFLSHGVMVYLAIAIALATSYILNRTKIGLNLRAVGENPATADAVGINVTKYRYLATCIGCGISGLGGLFFIMDYLNGNWEYCIDAMGWLSIALVIFVVWRPSLSILGSFVFGALYIIASYKAQLNIFLDSELLKMFPYLATIIVLIFVSIRNKRENQPPAGLGLNYYREER